MSEVKLLSSDGIEYAISPEAAKMSTTISDQLEDAILEIQDPIELQVSSKILERVMDYCEYCVVYPMTDKEEEESQKDLLPYEKEFINEDHATLFGITLAANYLGIQSLLYLGCKGIALLIKDKNLDQIREMFGIDRDFTDEEYANFRELFPWLNLPERVKDN